jgi:RNA polymerase sigma-70 factor, ECF subfamily
MSLSTRAHLRLIPLEMELPAGAHRPALDDSEQPALDDSELLAALRCGDASAATALYDRTRAVVERTVARLLGGSDCDAPDVVQLAFIELVHSIQTFRGDCPLDAWVSVISARVVYKHIRRRRLERRLFSAVPVQALGLCTEVTRQELVFRGALRRVQAHLAQVDDNRAWTFLLHDVFGYDLREVAGITNVSVAAAQSRLVRGRREVHARVHADPELAGLVREACGVDKYS